MPVLLIRPVALAASGFLSAGVQAHEGHGAPAIGHFHASDAWGFVMLGVCLVAALWWSRRK